MAGALTLKSIQFCECVFVFLFVVVVVFEVVFISLDSLRWFLSTDFRHRRRRWGWGWWWRWL